MCLFMFEQMPKGATLAQSKEDLASEAELEKIKLQNEKAREVIEYNNLLKKQMTRKQYFIMQRY